ncbi:menaquinone biosynthesis methyltransferase [Francisella tularensis subsp. tularensis 80700075]|nr:menaquinone biosynthesis methyltransferase [Francisella tularensis subsp. tularensis 80700075]
MSKENKTTDFGFTQVPWEENKKGSWGIPFSSS